MLGMEPTLNSSLFRLRINGHSFIVLRNVILNRSERILSVRFNFDGMSR